jgi:acylphosphatase
MLANAPLLVENLQQGLICYYLQVTGEAQGEQSALSQFVQHLNKGPPAARVSTVDHSDIATKEGEKGFNE